MDSLINAAARALAAGDALGALNRVALRDDAAALALRGIAMAQLGDLEKAKGLLKRAGRAFGEGEAAARARCVVAEAEIALVTRDLGGPERALEAAGAVLARHGDAANAAHARYLGARRLALLGRLDDAEAALAGLEPAALPPAARAGCELVAAGIAMRRLKSRAARAALGRAREAAARVAIAGLTAEVEAVAAALDAPAARLLARGAAREVRLDEVEDLLGTPALVVDACRHVVRAGGEVVSLETRPVLFAILRALGEAWPGDAGRAELVARAFRGKEADESHRARLRVEVGRLRAGLKGIAEIRATGDGFRLVAGREVVVLAHPAEDPNGAVLALLADGEAWSSSALALALGTSQRSVQRALEALAGAGKVQRVGRGRALRWMAPPVPGFPTALLLPALPGGG